MSLTVITTAVVKQIRELHAAGVSQKEIVKQLGLHHETVRRYISDEAATKIKAYQRARYDRERNDPEIVERRRAAMREYARRQRALAKNDPNRPETKREAARRMKRERAEVEAAAPKQLGSERECLVCGTRFRTIYRNNTCSPEHRDEWTTRRLARRAIKRNAGGIDDCGSAPFGSAGGGHRMGGNNGE